MCKYYTVKLVVTLIIKSKESDSSVTVTVHQQLVIPKVYKSGECIVGIKLNVTLFSHTSNHEESYQLNVWYMSCAPCKELYSNTDKLQSSTSSKMEEATSSEADVSSTCNEELPKGDIGFTGKSLPSGNSRMGLGYIISWVLVPSSNWNNDSTSLIQLVILLSWIQAKTCFIHTIIFEIKFDSIGKTFILVVLL